MGRENTLTGHKVIYYPKFHCELNHNIEYFWCDDGKNWTCRDCQYTLEGFKRRYIPKASLKPGKEKL